EVVSLYQNPSRQALHNSPSSQIYGSSQCGSAGDNGMLSEEDDLAGSRCHRHEKPSLGEDNRSVSYYLAIVAAHVPTCAVAEQLAAAGPQEARGGNGCRNRSDAT